MHFSILEKVKHYRLKQLAIFLFFFGISLYFIQMTIAIYSKIIRSKDKNDILIAKEKGFNSCKKVDHRRCKAAED